MTLLPPIPPEERREAQQETQSILKLLLAPANAKTVFDLSWKLIPLLWMGFHFYANQDAISKKTEANETKIINLETEINKLDRDIVEVRAEEKALHDQAEYDRQYYIQIQPKPK